MTIINDTAITLTKTTYTITFNTNGSMPFFIRSLAHTIGYDWLRPFECRFARRLFRVAVDFLAVVADGPIRSQFEWLGL